MQNLHVDLVDPSISAVRNVTGYHNIKIGHFVASQNLRNAAFHLALQPIVLLSFDYDVGD
jgi:hypothetical protein